MADLTVTLLRGDSAAASALRASTAGQQQLRTFLQEAAAHGLHFGEQDRDGEREVPQSPNGACACKKPDAG